MYTAWPAFALGIQLKVPSFGVVSAVIGAIDCCNAGCECLQAYNRCFLQRWFLASGRDWKHVHPRIV